jgi:hypothetical protein
MRSLITPLVITTCLTLFGCGEKYALDKQMEELCKKDGGVKVFEQVKLPAKEFNTFGEPLFLHQNSTTNPMFQLIEQTETVAGTRGNSSNGYLNRTSSKVLRLADAKVLGESTIYFRVGGDGLSAVVHWHPSSSSCPDSAKNIIQSIFIKGE